jgi:hypothetical protein
MTELDKSSSTETDISVAWIRALEQLVDVSGHHVENLKVSIDIGPNGVSENPLVRSRLNKFLAENGFATIDTVANTIFPHSLWNPSAPRQQLYDRYLASLPRIKRCPANRRGTYFQRMIAFGHGEAKCNQLEHVIENWRNGNHRHSAFQIGIFDPVSDHIRTPYLGFPCLHQVCFNPRGANGQDGLGMTAFYATQHLLNKAYGNYLGLIRLGQFVAKETDLDLVNVTCIAGAGDLKNSGVIQMKTVRELLANLQSL